MRKIVQVFTENIGSLFSLWYQSNKTLTSSIQKKKNCHTIPTKISFTSQSSKFCAFKAHIYQLSLVGNTWTIPSHEGEITGSNEDSNVPKPDLAAWTRTKSWLKLGLQPLLMHSRPNLAFEYKLDWSYHFVTTGCI